MTKQSSARPSWELDPMIHMGPFLLEILYGSDLLGFSPISAADTPHHVKSGFVQSGRLGVRAGEAPA